MSLADELNQLADLHARGALSDAEFAQAKARALGLGVGGPSTAGGSGALNAVNTLQRSRGDRWLGGVCGGLGRVTSLAPWVWRSIFTLLVLCAGTGVFVYLMLWILVPQEAAPFASGQGPLAAR